MLRTLRRKHVYIISICIVCMFIVIISFIVSALNNLETIPMKRLRIEEVTVENEIRLQVLQLNNEYKVRQTQFDEISDGFIKNVKRKSLGSGNESVFIDIWNRVNENVKEEQLYDSKNDYLGTAIEALRSATILKADVYPKGTQLKILLHLRGGQKAVFKPQWYPKEEIIHGSVYSGNDRYGSEILAFYLSGILNIPLVAISTERIVDLTNEIVPISTKTLRNTIFSENNKTCVYGKCFYCKKEKSVCETKPGELHGAIIVNIPGTFVNNRSPWQRTYKKGKKAMWEYEENYCKYVRSKLKKNRILDLVDTHVFDFLIQNGDRHHYETFNDKIVLFDNGKGLGNPHIHHIDILAPLYQCCHIRKTTWERLRTLSGGLLGEILESITELREVVSDAHIKAIDERLLYVYATIEMCLSKNILLYD